MSYEEKAIEILLKDRCPHALVAKGEVFGYDQKMERMLIILRWIEFRRLFGSILKLERVEIKWVAMPVEV